MGSLQGGGHRTQQCHSPHGGKRGFSAKQCPKILPLYIGHHQVQDSAVLPRVEDRQGVRVVEGAGHLDLSGEPPTELGILG
jgi:hypothetical protein